MGRPAPAGDVVVVIDLARPSDVGVEHYRVPDPRQQSLEMSDGVGQVIEHPHVVRHVTAQARAARGLTFDVAHEHLGSASVQCGPNHRLHEVVDATVDCGYSCGPGAQGGRVHALEAAD